MRGLIMQLLEVQWCFCFASQRISAVFLRESVCFHTKQTFHSLGNVYHNQILVLQRCSCIIRYTHQSSCPALQWIENPFQGRSESVTWFKHQCGQDRKTLTTHSQSIMILIHSALFSGQVFHKWIIHRLSFLSWKLLLCWLVITVCFQPL